MRLGGSPNSGGIQGHVGLAEVEVRELEVVQQRCRDHVVGELCSAGSGDGVGEVARGREGSVGLPGYHAGLNPRRRRPHLGAGDRSGGPSICD